jgi:hypothetical protein
MQWSLAQTMLPGSDAASPLIGQKITAIWRKHTAILNFLKCRNFSAIYSIFSTPTFNFRMKFSPNCNVYGFFLQIYATQNSDIFPLLLGKTTAVPLSRLRRISKNNSLTLNKIAVHTHGFRIL